jgi:hypothetical protein
MLHTPKQRQLFQMRLLEEITDLNYAFTRYQINYSIAIGHTEEAIDMTPLSTYLRKSDRLVVLDEHLCAIIFNHTDDEGGIKAANNLLTYFQTSYFSKSLYACVVTASNHSDPSQAVHALFDLLNYAVSQNMNNLILDISQVTSH